MESRAPLRGGKTGRKPGPLLRLGPGPDETRRAAALGALHGRVVDRLGAGEADELGVLRIPVEVVEFAAGRALGDEDFLVFMLLAACADEHDGPGLIDRDAVALTGN